MKQKYDERDNAFKKDIIENKLLEERINNYTNGLYALKHTSLNSTSRNYLCKKILAFF